MGYWHLWTSDPDERARFGDLARVLALPAEPAGPPNRLRHVRRIASGGGGGDGCEVPVFLKVFTATQWQNRLRFAATAPRAASDAERERRVTVALRAAGFAAPRPLASGRAGATSYYLCAALPGRPLADLLASGGGEARLRAAAAAHCGRVLAAGFHLPDLSADHLFVEPAGTGWHFAVLDLHNGAIARPGPPPRRLLRRVLRRFAKSVRGLPVTRGQAMAFAARLLAAAGAPRRVRRTLLERQAPFATAARYEAAGKSAAYAERNPRRAARELDLLRRVWPGQPGERVLDLPCGAGRLLPFLREHSHTVVQADGAMAMLREAGERSTDAPWRLQADALAVPLVDGAVDGVVVFRFLHHLPTADARRAIAEACRTARRFVVVSFFHPCSAHHVRRRVQKLGGTAPTRHARTLAQVRADFAAAGFALHGHAADLPFVRDLWLASFVRR